MAYKTYSEQVYEHLAFLQDKGLDVSELCVDAGEVRCHAMGSVRGRGELVYRSWSNTLNNGLCGLATWCRGVDGIKADFKTYGLAPDGTCIAPLPLQKEQQHRKNQPANEEAAARRAFGFWKHSSEIGVSDYLRRKGVGCHGIRFRSSENFKNSAVVPMRDLDGRLWSYQILNGDGTKRFPKDARVEGLFHVLNPITDDSLIGVAESYVTAATCMENTGITCVCCFGCNNIKSVLSALLGKHSNSRFVIFADNDCHLQNNTGLLKAQEAQKLCKERVGVGCS